MAGSVSWSADASAPSGQDDGGTEPGKAGIRIVTGDLNVIAIPTPLRASASPPGTSNGASSQRLAKAAVAVASP